MRLAKAVLVLFAVLFCARAEAQGYRGTDFWICFPHNAIWEQGSGLQQILYIASDYRTSGFVEAPDDTTKIPFNVEAGAAVSVPIDSTYQLLSSSQVERKSLHVTSDHPITLYVVSHRKASTDSYAAIPTSMLGTQYIIAGYTTLESSGGYQQFATQAQIIATEDNTLVTAVLTGSTNDGTPAGRTISLPMNRGDVFQLKGGGTVADLTGTIVTATKPVAFFTGHRCAQVSAPIRFCDMLVEMEPPAGDWGKDFIATKFQQKDGYVLRVAAKDDSTSVFVNGKQAAMLQHSGWYEIDTLHHDAVIHTSKPVVVAQYATGSEADTERVGDPFMLLLTPNDRFVKETTTTSIEMFRWTNYVNIVVPDSSLNDVRIDGRAVNTSAARKIEKFAILPYEVSSGTHAISCSVPVAVYSYGFGILGDNFDSYGHTCGMRLDENNPPK